MLPVLQALNVNSSLLYRYHQSQDVYKHLCPFSHMYITSLKPLLFVGGMALWSNVYCECMVMCVLVAIDIVGGAWLVMCVLVAIDIVGWAWLGSTPISVLYSSLSQSNFPLLCCLRGTTDFLSSLLRCSLLSLWALVGPSCWYHDLLWNNGNCVARACWPCACGSPPFKFYAHTQAVLYPGSACTYHTHIQENSPLTWQEGGSFTLTPIIFEAMSRPIIWVWAIKGGHYHTLPPDY